MTKTTSTPDTFETNTLTNIITFPFVKDTNDEILKLGECPACGTLCSAYMEHCDKCGQAIKAQ